VGIVRPQFLVGIYVRSASLIKFAHVANTADQWDSLSNSGIGTALLFALAKSLIWLLVTLYTPMPR
jgi:hypothetical protein